VEQFEIDFPGQPIELPPEKKKKANEKANK
jgi:hypothetical protein